MRNYLSRLNGQRTQGALVIFTGIVLWQVYTQSHWQRQGLIPAPLDIGRTMLNTFASGVLLQNIISSLWRVLLGFGAACILAILLGTLLGYYKHVSPLFTPLIELMRPIPPIAWIPLAILWFGLGNQAAIFIVAVGAFFPIFVNTFSGVRLVNRQHFMAARTLGANTFTVIGEVLLPAALPQMLTGIRLGAGSAWASVIAAEMIGTRDGLGYAIQLNRTMLEIESVFVNMLTIGLIGWVLNWWIVYFEQRFIKWNQDDRYQS